MSARKVEIGEAFGEGHFDETGVEIEAAEVAFGEGNEDLTGFALHDEERCGAGGAVDVADGADGDGGGGGDVDEGTANEVADVGLVWCEWDALGEGDGHAEADEGFGGGDGVDAGEVEDDAALMKPVMEKLDGAGESLRGKCLAFWGWADVRA